MWSECIKRSKSAVPVKEEPAKKVDWEERHFQICLALLSRTDIDKDARTAIIARADRMVEELKKHYEELAMKK